jgi:hypothetical protein
MFTSKKLSFVSFFPIGQDSIPAHMAANLRTGNLSGGTPDFAAGHQDVKQVGREAWLPSYCITIQVSII